MGMVPSETRYTSPIVRIGLFILHGQPFIGNLDVLPGRLWGWVRCGTITRFFALSTSRFIWSRLGSTGEMPNCAIIVRASGNWTSPIGFAGAGAWTGLIRGGLPGLLRRRRRGDLGQADDGVLVIQPEPFPVNAVFSECHHSHVLLDVEVRSI